jgi:cysteinyl-tRNA synthetase
MDFVLWKPSDERQTNYPLPKWQSPCDIVTPGRPGWHIECSAMSAAILGETFDIHGGGIDLIFPHHENEIAQSRCAFHTNLMANYWMHNGFLQVEGEKMAKSAGNFVTIRKLLDDGWPGEVLRFNMLRTHYRQPIDWTLQGLSESMKTLDRWYLLDTRSPQEGDQLKYLDQDFVGALADDLNTPRALSHLHSIYAEIRTASGLREIELKRKLKVTAGLVGLLRADTKEWLTRTHKTPEANESQVEALVDARNAARKAKNFKEADRIRDELKEMGIELEDKKDGTTIWKVAR